MKISKQIARAKWIDAIILVVALWATTYFLLSYEIAFYPRHEVQFSDEWFFLSVGLYQNRTHPCLVHTVTCEAEFKSTNLNYTIVSEDCVYFVQGIGKTNEKGFFDLYLPKGKNYTATFSIAGKMGGGTISTHEGASNCITEIRVSN